MHPNSRKSLVRFGRVSSMLGFAVGCSLPSPGLTPPDGGSPSDAGRNDAQTGGAGGTTGNAGANANGGMIAQPGGRTSAAGTNGTGDTTSVGGADGSAGMSSGGTTSAGGGGGTAGTTSSGGTTSDGGMDGGVAGMTGTCPTGRTRCGQTCVDTSTDPGNCGACARACSSAGTTGTPACAAGVCQPSCMATFADCNDPSAPSADDGCEVKLTTSASNCGACGHTCYLGACNGTCQPWKVVDSPNTSLPALLVTDGTYVVWLDSGLTSIRQAKFDKTGIMTLGQDATAFASAFGTFGGAMSLGGGIVVLATQSGVYDGVLNTASTGSHRLAFNTPAGTSLSALGLDPTGKHLGLAGTKPSPQASQIYDCQMSNVSCTPVGASFTGGVYGASANASAYYFMNAQAGAVQDFTFGSTTIKTLQGNASISGFVTLDSTSAYWLADSNGKVAIWRGALSNGSVTETVTSFPLNTTTWSDLVTDGKNVYFTAAGDSAYVGYASAGGAGQTAKVLAGVSSAVGVAAAAGKVFWIDGTAIWAVAAP